MKNSMCKLIFIAYSVVISLNVMAQKDNSNQNCIQGKVIVKHQDCNMPLEARLGGRRHKENHSCQQL